MFEQHKHKKSFFLLSLSLQIEIQKQSQHLKNVFSALHFNAHKSFIQKYKNRNHVQKIFHNGSVKQFGIRQS